VCGVVVEELVGEERRKKCYRVRYIRIFTRFINRSASLKQFDQMEEQIYLRDTPGHVL